MLKDILHDTDSVFLKWAINQILNWRNKNAPQNLIHIHGTGDKILPIHFVKCDLKVKKGGHLMILNKAKEISQMLRGALN